MDNKLPFLFDKGTPTITLHGSQWISYMVLERQRLEDPGINEINLQFKVIKVFVFKLFRISNPT